MFDIARGELVIGVVTLIVVTPRLWS